MSVASIDPGTAEQLFRGVSALTVDPVKNVVTYFFPFVEAFFQGYQNLRVDETLEASMPCDSTKKILQEIQTICEQSGVTREVSVYTALNHRFSSCGGSFSFSRPGLFIPVQHLFRGGHSHFGAENPDEKLQAKLFIFSDDETRFLIARQVVDIRENNVLLRLVTKVCFIAIIFTIFASPYGWGTAALLFVAASISFLASERFLNQKADVLAMQNLKDLVKNPKKAAISALDKMRAQNLYRREHSKLAKWYITTDGNNVLDFAHPFLTSRIQRLKAQP